MITRKIVAIGGGEIGRPKDEKDGGGFYPIETTEIDEEIIRLTGKKSPKLLLLPTASGDHLGYYDIVKKHFQDRLGCQTDVLYTIGKDPSRKEIRDKVFGSDIIYVGGGNTLNMLLVWKRIGLDKILREAYDRGIVLSGVSAGAVCWARYANSDSRPKLGKNNYGYIKMNALNFVPLTLSPHHTSEENRDRAFRNIMKRTPGVGIALDDCAALEIIDDKYRVITSRKSAGARLVYLKEGRIHDDERLPVDGKFRKLEELKR
jgi:dipeptidase E